MRITLIFLLLSIVNFSTLLSQEKQQIISHIQSKSVISLGEHQKAQAFFKAPIKSGVITSQWVDSKGRVCEIISQTISKETAMVSFDFKIKNPLGYQHTIIFKYNNTLQNQTAKFTLEYPYQKNWKDYQASVWAHYPKAYSKLLREAGVTASIWSGSSGVEGDLPFYVDNILYEMFSYYHKRKSEGSKMRELWEAKPLGRKTVHRRPSLTDKSIYEKMKKRLGPIIKKTKAFRPLFYNLADEIGICDQSSVSDLDWEYSNRTQWKIWLKRKYRNLNALNQQWGKSYTTWHQVRSFFPSTHTLYDELWVKHLLPKAFHSIKEFQQQFNTKHLSFHDFVLAYSKVKSNDEALLAKGITKRFKNKIEGFNKHFKTSLQNFDQAQAFVAKWEGWVSQQDATDTRNWNLSWWCDWREYMDTYMAKALGKARDLGREIDPEGTFGITGTHHPGVFSGHNYSKLMQNLDFIMPYDIGQSFELLRGLKTNYPYMHPTWQTTQKFRRDLWNFFLDGCRGVLIWDNHEKKHRLIDRKTFKLTARGQAGAATMKEISNGLDQLLLQSKRENYGIALYHSMASARINWVHQFVSLGRKWIQRFSWHEYKQDERNALRSSWVKLIEDNGLQFIFVTPEQVASHRLHQEAVKVLILPEIWALSQTEANNIKAFVHQGGLVIADQFTGLFDGNGKRRSKGVLDDAMGIDQSKVAGDYRFTKTKLAPQQLELISPINALLPKGTKLEDLNTRFKAQSSKVSIASKSASYKAGNKKNAAIISHNYGKGKFVFLNLDVSYFNRIRIAQEKSSQREKLIALIGHYLKQKVPPFAIVNNKKTKKRQQGVETVLWHTGKTRKVLSFTRNIQTNKEGIGGEAFKDNSIFEQEEQVTVHLAKKHYVINQRTGESLGHQKEFSFTLKPFEASLFSLMETKPNPIDVKFPQAITLGDEIVLEITDGNSTQDYLRVYYIKVINPQGQEVWYYSKDISAQSPLLKFKLQTALNDQLGKWSFFVTDIFSKSKFKFSINFKK